MTEAKTGLFKAVEQGDIHSISALLETASQDLVNATIDGQTAFELALDRGFKNVALKLLHSPEFAINDGERTPLQLCIELGYLDIADTLLEMGANPNIATRTSSSALLTAIDNEHFSLAQKMLDKGAEVNVRNHKGWTPLIWAASTGRRQAVEFLLEHGADIHICNHDGWNAVTGAYVKQHLDIVEILASRGASFGEKYSVAAMMSAGLKGDIAMVKRLLDLGVSPNVCFDDGDSLLSKVIQNGDIELAKELLEAGANPNIDTGIHSPLNWAAKRSDVSLVDLLIEKGAIVNTRQGSALYSACFYNQVDVVKSLLNAGANADYAHGNAKVTPLMIAAQYAYLNVVEKLLEYGANPFLLNAKNENALKVAKSQGKMNLSYKIEYPTHRHLDVIKLLSSLGLN